MIAPWTAAVHGGGGGGVPPDRGGSEINDAGQSFHREASTDDNTALIALRTADVFLRV